MIWHEQGGSGSRSVVLLHGMGATAAVWDAVCCVLSAQGAVRWLAADLSGHGASSWQSPYSIGQFAAAIAPVWPGGEVFIIGHSLGAYVALALAGGGFGVPVRGVLGIGPKIAWTASELATARELAARPPRWYASAEEAVARYRRVSGLGAEIAAGPAWLARGVLRGAEGWRLAQDPRTFGVAGAEFAPLASGAAARLMLARGEHDAMVTEAELREHAPDVHSICGAGHNAHVEQPAAVIALLESLMRGASAAHD
jgi:pimeloyl-ACP methyl ester carboxylesterase